MTNLQIGAQLYSVRDHLTSAEEIRNVLVTLKKQGYNICQLSGFSREVPVEVIADILKEVDMKCVCTHFGFTEFEENFDELVRIHKLWNCEYPGVGAMPAEFPRTKEGYLEFARRANIVADKLAEHGLHFIYHNHAFELEKFDGITGLEILMENCSANLQFELDLFWIQAGGGAPEDWIEKVRGRMDVVHFKEMVGGTRQLPIMAPIGDGNMNWPRLMAKCDEIGVKYALIEQDNAVETDSIACMERSINYLTSIGGRF